MVTIANYLDFLSVSALTAGKDVTWGQMKTFGQKQIDELSGLAVEATDPKDESELNN